MNKEKKDMIDGKHHAMVDNTYENDDNTLSVLITEEQREYLEAKAKAAGVPFSEFMVKNLKELCDMDPDAPAKVNIEQLTPMEACEEDQK